MLRAQAMLNGLNVQEPRRNSQHLSTARRSCIPSIVWYPEPHQEQASIWEQLLSTSYRIQARPFITPKGREYLEKCGTHLVMALAPTEREDQVTATVS